MQVSLTKDASVDKMQQAEVLQQVVLDRSAGKKNASLRVQVHQCLVSLVLTVFQSVPLHTQPKPCCATTQCKPPHQKTPVSCLVTCFNQGSICRTQLPFQNWENVSNVIDTSPHRIQVTLAPVHLLQIERTPTSISVCSQRQIFSTYFNLIDNTITSVIHFPVVYMLRFNIQVKIRKTLTYYETLLMY